jgi:hypothetical protein
MKIPWLQSLRRLAEEKRLVIIRFDEAEWSVAASMREFTVARAHGLFEGLGTPALCLIVGTDIHDEFMGDKVASKSVHFGLISSRSAITTLESRIKVRRCMRIQPDSEASLRKLVTEKPHAKNLVDRLRSKSSVVELSPKLGSHVIERLHRSLRTTALCALSPSRCHRRSATGTPLHCRRTRSARRSMRLA